jgi:hypothetical protein
LRGALQQRALARPQFAAQAVQRRRVQRVPARTGCRLEQHFAGIAEASVDLGGVDRGRQQQRHGGAR